MKPLYKIMVTSINKVDGKPRKIYNAEIFTNSVLTDYLIDFSVDYYTFDHNALTQELNGKLLNSNIDVKLKILNVKLMEAINWQL